MAADTATSPTPVREGRVTLSGIGWDMYEQIVEQQERDGMCQVLTYDNGVMEVEMPSELHEFVKRFVAEMLAIYFLTSGTRYVPAGQTTYKRRVIHKGLEADEAYYLTNLNRIDQSGRREDRMLPPPDLAIEVEVTAPLLDKLGIYAAIGVVEIWHISLSTGRPVVRILSLVDGAYVDHNASPAVPYFTTELLTRWVTQRLAGDHFETLQAFRKSLDA